MARRDMAVWIVGIDFGQSEGTRALAIPDTLALFTKSVELDVMTAIKRKIKDKQK